VGAKKTAGDGGAPRKLAAMVEVRDAAEVELLAKLRDRRPALGELLAKCSDHWGYEDPVYRFYHQRSSCSIGRRSATIPRATPMSFANESGDGDTHRWPDERGLRRSGGRDDRLAVS